MSIFESLSTDDRHKLQVFLEASKHQLQDIDDIKESLRDKAKGLAEEFAVKPKHLMAAARTAYKNDLGQKKEDMTTMEDILTATGHG
jgi:hypothetical protein